MCTCGESKMYQNKRHEIQEQINIEFLSISHHKRATQQKNKSICTRSWLNSKQNENIELNCYSININHKPKFNVMLN